MPAIESRRSRVRFDPLDCSATVRKVLERIAGGGREQLDRELVREG